MLLFSVDSRLCLLSQVVCEVGMKVINRKDSCHAFIGGGGPGSRFGLWAD